METGFHCFKLVSGEEKKKPFSLKHESMTVDCSTAEPQSSLISHTEGCKPHHLNRYESKLTQNSLDVKGFVTFYICIWLYFTFSLLSDNKTGKF